MNGYEGNIAPIRLERKNNGTVSRFGGQWVYLDAQADFMFNRGEVWMCELKEGSRSRLYARPLMCVDADFIMGLSVPNRFELLVNLFLAGGKSGKVLDDVVARVDPGEIAMLAAKDSLYDENGRLRAELESSDAAVGRLTAERDGLQTEIVRLRSMLESPPSAPGEHVPTDLEIELAGRVESLKGELETARRDLASVTDTCRTKDSAMDSLKEQISNLNAFIDDRDCRVSALEDENAELRRRSEESAPNPAPRRMRPGITVRRDSPNTISSDWLTHDRYRVVLNGSLDRMRVYPDPDGNVRCDNYALDVPFVNGLRPFKGMAYLEAVFSDDMGYMEVVL